MHSPSTTRRPPPKTLLYCPDCWRAAPPGGDWLIRRTGDDEAIVCPECGALLTVRRGTGADVASA